MKREEAYRWAIGQVRSKVKNHVDVIATLANTAAILKERIPDFFWVGFYLLKSDHLILGPFQGPPACVKLSLESGVCAASVRSGKTVIVPDVGRYPGHVTCDSRSKSEIVVPLKDQRDRIKGVLDVDSVRLNDFGQLDGDNLEKIATELRSIWV